MTIERTGDSGLRPNYLRNQTAPNTLAGLSPASNEQVRRRLPLGAMAFVALVALALAAIVMRAV